MKNPKNILFNGLVSMWRITRGLVNLIKLPFNKGLYSSESYFPELASQRKSRLRIFMDQCKHILRCSAPEKFYFLYGFDIKGLRNQEEYVDAFYEFSVTRDRLNKAADSPYIVLRDKSLFGIVADAYGINTPHNLGIIQNGCFYDYSNKETFPLNHFSQLPFSPNDIEKKEKHLFIKMIDGECANGVYSVIIKDEAVFYKGKQINPDSFFEKKKRYLVQEAIPNQHTALSALHSRAINTVRLCTVYNKQTDKIEVFSCVLRVGTGVNNVDNWAAGGLSIGIDTDKCSMREYGFYKPGFGTKTTEHPDSHIVFKDYRIPYLTEAVNQAKEFHHRLYGIHSIGWDIAITENGPCFIEGNDNWEISLMQISNHGLKKEFDQLFH